MSERWGLDDRCASMGAVLDAASVPIVILDRETRIVGFNARFRALQAAEVGAAYAPAEPGLCERVRAVCEGRADGCEYAAQPATFAGNAYAVRAVSVAAEPARLVVVTHVPSGGAAEAQRMRRELDALRQQLLQLQKLESVGRLTSGLAHDFNNMLTSIICFTRFVVDEMVDEDPRRADLIEVLRSADHAARLTNQLLVFARRKPLQPVTINVNDAVTSVGRVLRRTVGENIELVIERSDDALWVSCDPGQFDQLLFNLAVIANDALPGGGAIRVRLGSLRGSDSAGVPSGDYVELVVVQRAAQAAAPPRAEVGEPGSGVGLAICRAIAEQANGALLPYTCAAGTGYRVLLPAAEPRPGGAPRVSLAPMQLRGTVLVVEDQPVILKTMVRALSSTGLAVLEANSAEDALAVLDARPQLWPELVVTDIVLPRMSGPHLVQQLRARFPGLPALFVSGYIAEEIAAGIDCDAGTAFVMKPFTGRQLAVRAAALLEQRTAASASKTKPFAGPT